MITPPSLIAVLETGWNGAVPLLHPSAGGDWASYVEHATAEELAAGLDPFARPRPNAGRWS